MNMIQRLADRVDLAIDALTLGQYGLEFSDTTSARDAGCEGGGCDCRREALPPARSRGRRRAGTTVAVGPMLPATTSP